MRHQRLIVLVAVGSILLAACGGATVASPTSALAPVATATGPAPTVARTQTPATAVPSASTGVLVPGTHVSLDPPPEFRTATTFTGFEHECGASIVVAELPTSYAELVAGFTDEGLAGQGVTNVSRAQITVDGRAATSISGKQTIQDILFFKGIVLTGTDESTAIVTGNVPVRTCESEVGDSIVDAITSFSFDPDRLIDPEAGLPFTLEPQAPLVFAGTFVNGVIYNTSGKVPSADVDEPTLIVASSFGISAGDDLETTAKAQLATTATLQDIHVESAEDVAVGGLEGVRLFAKGTRTSGSTKVFIDQVLLRQDKGFTILLGVCRVKDRAACAALFKSTVATFRPKVPG